MKKLIELVKNHKYKSATGLAALGGLVYYFGPDQIMNWFDYVVKALGL